MNAKFLGETQYFCQQTQKALKYDFSSHQFFFYHHVPLGVCSFEIFCNRKPEGEYFVIPCVIKKFWQLNHNKLQISGSQFFSVSSVFTRPNCCSDLYFSSGVNVTAALSLAYHNLQCCACGLEKIHHMTSWLTAAHIYLVTDNVQFIMEGGTNILYKCNTHVYPLPQ